MAEFSALVFKMLDVEIASTPQARPMVEALASNVSQLPPTLEPQEPVRLPVCDHLQDALRAAQAHGPEAARVANAFAALEPMLQWRLRAGAAAQGDSFLHGHANALLIGHGDYAKPQRVTLGISLLAPGVAYPDHAHPPEELYVVLAPGRWRQNRGPWQHRPAGGLVHNPPGINHGMEAEAGPLLALWFLWNREALTRAAG